MTTPSHTSVLIVGSGFSGLGLGHRLLEERFTDFTILERADGVGGVWKANTYPGCRCDVASHLYSFSFAPNPEWSSTYSPQPEIRAYLERCAVDFGLQSHLRFGVEVTGAAWSEDEQLWHVETSTAAWTCRVLVSAVGPLTEPKLPNVPGIDRFAGKVMHSSQWDDDFDLAGKRVASIGTGASAIQYVPAIADTVGELYVFQRSAPWIMPHDKRPITDEERAKFRADPKAQRKERNKVYVAKEALLLAFAKQPKLMKAVEGLSRKHRESQVTDAALLPLLEPDYTLGCKRILPSNDWYPALQKPNVHLVPKALAEIREHSVVDVDGVEREVDVIIFGTGFQVTQMPFADRVRGRDGRLLNDLWAGSPRAYLGTSIPGYPNFFMFLGPNTGLGHSSMVYMIEAQLTHITNAIRALDVSGSTSIEVTPDAHDRYNAWIDRKLEGTVWESGCATFYQDANGRNATIYPDWTWKFRNQTKKWDAAAYRLEKRPPRASDVAAKATAGSAS